MIRGEFYCPEKGVAHKGCPLQRYKLDIPDSRMCVRNKNQTSELTLSGQRKHEWEAGGQGVEGGWSHPAFEATVKR